MGIYKVLKDFPSRNGVKQYKTGESITLDNNSRTKALLEMGYIGDLRRGVIVDLPAFIATTLHETGRFKRVKIRQLSKDSKTNYIYLIVEEK